MKAGLFLVAVSMGTVVFPAPSAGATRPPSLQVAPAAVRAGELLAFTAYCPVNDRPTGPVTSPGLAAPVPLTGHTGGEYVGTGKAGDKPGRFTATIQCPNWSLPVTTTFTVSSPFRTSRG